MTKQETIDALLVGTTLNRAAAVRELKTWTLQELTMRLERTRNANKIWM
jgi:hypothetical protein